jgi:hypothetical protein
MAVLPSATVQRVQEDPLDWLVFSIQPLELWVPTTNPPLPACAVSTLFGGQMFLINVP